MIETGGLSPARNVRTAPPNSPPRSTSRAPFGTPPRTPILLRPSTTTSGSLVATGVAINRRVKTSTAINMKFFIDTANLSQIREAHELGVLDGVTTNPSLMAKEGITGKKNILNHYSKIFRILNKIKHLLQFMEKQL